MMITRKSFFIVSSIVLMLLLTACGGSAQPNTAVDTNTNNAEPAVDYDATSAALAATADSIATANAAAAEPTAPPVISDPPPPEDTGSSEFLVYTGFDSFEDEDGKWNVFTIYGSNNYSALVGDGFLTASLGAPNETLYIVYEPLWMERGDADVLIEIGFDNVGDVRSNNISAVCRGTEEGWYEFSLGSDGLWAIWKYDATDGYSRLANGGIAGYDWKISNHYLTAACIGDSLAFSIDGVIPKGAEVTDSSFREGQVGFSVTTFDNGGVEVEFDYFIADYP